MWELAILIPILRYLDYQFKILVLKKNPTLKLTSKLNLELKSTLRIDLCLKLYLELGSGL